MVGRGCPAGVSLTEVSCSYSHRDEFGAGARGLPAPGVGGDQNRRQYERRPGLASLPEAPLRRSARPQSFSRRRSGSLDVLGTAGHLLAVRFPPRRCLSPFASAALLLAVGCDPSRPFSSTEAPAAPALSTAGLSNYFPPSEAVGGWRKATDSTQILGLGVDAGKLAGLGSYLTSLPYESYNTGVSGYSPSNKAAIVVKNGWIVGEYYNQASAATGVYYLASNGKTFAMLLAGHMAREYPQHGFGLASQLYDQRWLPQGLPVTDARKADITFDQVFRHTSGIIPEVEDPIASSAVQPGTTWNFAPVTVGTDADYPVTAPLYFAPGEPSTYTKGSTYSSVAFNHFSLIFSNVTGLEASVYLHRAILEPIGVGRMAYKRTTGMGDYVWATAGNGLSSARDFARLGYLMLHEGRWDGIEIFEAAWLRQFTTSPVYRNIRSNVDCRWGNKFPSDMYRTTGSGQNWALVVPSLDLVLTFNGRTPKSLASAIDATSLNKLFAAVTERYVACDGTVFNDTPPPSENAAPTAGFTSSCSGLACEFADGSTDSEGEVVAWSWTFGDGETSTARNPSHAYEADGTYTVELTVTDGQGATGSTSREASVTAANSLPTADFTSSCNGLTCTFTDMSTDADGSVTGWSWTFGDGGSSTARNPGRTYAAAGSYDVTLTVTDDRSATHQRTAPVTVTAPPAISLTATGREDATKQYMILRWTGARSSRIDIYRNGVLITNTPNDGRQTVSRKFTRRATYILKVCEAGTSTCSNQVTLKFD